MVVKLVYGNGTISDVGIVFRRFGGLNSRGTEVIEVVDARYRSEYSMVGLWAVNDAFPVLYSEGAASLVKACNRN